jgi:ATP-dependent DNA ligase
MKKSFPTLYAKAKTGKVKQYDIRAEGDRDLAYIIREHGYTDGKKQVDTTEVTQGKNLGKANETTPYEQACMEAESKWNHKKDKGYTEDKNPTGTEVMLPMLAQSYEKKSHKIEWPACVQPKLNGVRCLAIPFTRGTGTKKERKVGFFSRGGKVYNTLNHLTDNIHTIEPEVVSNTVFDGEIYLHNHGFQDIIRRVKKDRGEDTRELNYWIYDIADMSKTFEERRKTISLEFRAHGTKTNVTEGSNHEMTSYKMANLVMVPTFEVLDETEMKEYHKMFVECGFEGTIIRNKEGKYLCNHRSHDLLKYKDFHDAEYEIVGYTEGTGREAGCIVFCCRTKEGREFDVRPRGTMEERVDWFNDGESIVGKDLTVRYQELSEDGIPIFPVGITIRDYE